MTKVSVIPPTGAFAGNALFEGRNQHQNSHSPNTHWMDCYAAAYKRALELNVAMATDDVLPLAEADIAVYMAQKEPPQKVAALKCRYPHLKTVLVLLETALGASYTLNPRNHEAFDAIITYDERLVDEQRYFLLPPHAYDRARIRTGPAFADRRVGCLVGTNRRMRYRSGIMAMRKGWYFSWKDWIDYVVCPGELITYRSQVGRLLSGYASGTFDLYGEGWEIHPETRDFCLGIPRISTLEYLGNYRYSMAFENHAGAHSLISERLWDALWSDTVPVYLGNSQIGRYVPTDCFIDARRFRHLDEMLDWLAQSSEKEWSRYRNAGRDFIRSARIKPYLPESFAEAFLRPFVQLAVPTA